MAIPDGVTPNCAADFGRRCQAIGQERRCMADLQGAMSHPEFKSRIHGLVDELAAKYSRSLNLAKRTPFASIEVGTFKAVEDLRRAVEACEFRLLDWTSKLITMPDFILAEHSTLPLYEVTNDELGFPNGCTMAESYVAIKGIGGEILPPEAAFQYCIQYPDQLLRDWRVMYMNPVCGVGSPSIFRITNFDHDRRLSSTSFIPGLRCNGDWIWVYTKS